MPADIAPAQGLPLGDAEAPDAAHLRDANTPITITGARLPGMPMLHTMQNVRKSDHAYLDISRLRVAGGWLYITTAYDHTTAATTFVPDLEVFGPGC